MLPDGVAERCSLVPKSDRLAISLLINIDSSSHEIMGWEIQPTVI